MVRRHHSESIRHGAHGADRVRRPHQEGAQHTPGRPTKTMARAEVKAAFAKSTHAEKRKLATAIRLKQVRIESGGHHATSHQRHTGSGHSAESHRHRTRRR